MSDGSARIGPVLHVVVVGFHHKRGGQVEYSYPPLMPGKSLDCNELPQQWRHLPALALPDGAHNFTQDTVFFHLPSLEEPNSTVYGVSCYRQMDSQKLINRGQDVTRNSVQKSVCVLSCLPLYGLIQAKLELITHAYFDELDFTQTSLLQDTYNSLNMSLKDSLLQQGSQVFLGLSPREAIQTHGHRVLVLFKLMLLERRVLLFSSPVKPICTTLLTILSLFPDLIEQGLGESANYTPTKAVSTSYVSAKADSNSSEEFLEIRYSEPQSDSSRERSGSTRSCDLPQDFDLSCDDDLLQSTSNGHSVIPCGTTGNESHDRMNKVDVDMCSSVHSESTKSVAYNNLTHKGDIPTVNYRENGCDDVGTCKEALSLIKTEACNERRVGADPLGADPLGADPLGADPLGALSSTDTEASKSSSAESMTDDSQTLVPGPAGDAQSLSDVLTDDPSIMEDLLEADEDTVKFEEDKLMLEIDAALEDEIDSNNAQTLSIGNATVHYCKQSDSIEHETPPATPEARKERTGSISSATSILSNLSAGSASVSQKASQIRSKLASVWHTDEDGGDGFELLQMSPTRGKPLSSLDLTNMGFPLQIFTKGILCHPYLCLQNYDLITDVNVRGFVVGATNMLFKQKRHLLDVVYDLSDNEMSIHDSELRKQLTLSTADLRFVDYLMHRCISDEKNLYLEETEWEGGDEWIRGLFLTYLSSLLATISRGDEKSVDDFNSHFVSAWRSTHNYKAWMYSQHGGLDQVLPGHPFRGNLGVADVKLKLSHTMHNTDGGKKINAAMSQTGKVVLQTGKAVGGALTSAKSAVSKTFSSWFSSSTSSHDGEKEEEEAKEEEAKEE